MSDTGKSGVTPITLKIVRVHSVDQIFSVTVFLLNREGLPFGQNCLNNNLYFRALTQKALNQTVSLSSDQDYFNTSKSNII